MDYNVLQIFLPAFMIAFLGIVTVWTFVRAGKSSRLKPLSKSIPVEFKLIDIFFRVLLVLTFTIVIVYSYYPEYYYLAGPIHWLDSPVINTIGVLVLKTSLVWIIMAQFNIERTIAMINSGMEMQSFNKLFSYSQKLVLTGMLIMFFGFFITISSVIGILICTCAIVLFERLPKVSR